MSIVNTVKLKRVHVDELAVSASHGKNPSFIMPHHSTQLSPNVFYIGEAYDNDRGAMVSGIAILRFKEDIQAVSNLTQEEVEVTSRSESKVESRLSNCYSFYATGAYWKTAEPYIVDPTNTDGMTASFVYDAIASATSQWNGALKRHTIFGNRDQNGVANGIDINTPDGKNEVMFGSIAQSGVIAVTIVWGVFSGPVENREITEWDQLYDQVDYNWGDATVQYSKMDLQDVATHETGHAGGMGDEYAQECSEATMFGYASPGETKKRSLYVSDITGIRVLYEEQKGSPDNTGASPFDAQNSPPTRRNDSYQLAPFILLLLLCMAL
jgi:hypothetical protein